METIWNTRRIVRIARLLCLCVAAVSGWETVGAAPQDPARPNILLAIADDWSLHAGVYGTPWVETPTFDRLAREGLLFTKSYTPMAKCAPSRAILLTGRHLWQNEEAGNHMAYFPEKFKRGEKIDAGWVNDSDFEQQPIPKR